ncbi:MAG: lytic transglycosylase domain-containing protein [Alphaproteobacteria bacterium]
MTSQMIAACLLLAAQTYHVPPAVMIAMMHVEGGRVGQEVHNTNGSYDLGPMQVNTVWMPQLARLWGVDGGTARQWVRDNGCVNVYVSAWILRQKIDEAGYLRGGIARYHSATPWRGGRYAGKVIDVMEHKGLVAHELYAANPPPKSAAGAENRNVKIAKVDE